MSRNILKSGIPRPVTTRKAHGVAGKDSTLTKDSIRVNKPSMIIDEEAMPKGSDGLEARLASDGIKVGSRRSPIKQANAKAETNETSASGIETHVISMHAKTVNRGGKVVAASPTAAKSRNKTHPVKVVAALNEHRKSIIVVKRKEEKSDDKLRELESDLVVAKNTIRKLEDEILLEKQSQQSLKAENSRLVCDVQRFSQQTDNLKDFLERNNFDPVTMKRLEIDETAVREKRIHASMEVTSLQELILSYLTEMKSVTDSLKKEVLATTTE